jgi:hypothetical protein
VGTVVLYDSRLAPYSALIPQRSALPRRWFVELPLNIVVVSDYV